MYTKEESFETDAICQMESFSRVYRVKFVGYSLTKHFTNEDHLKIATFDLAGHRWAIKFYPNGCSARSEYISFFGSLLTETSIPLHVEYDFNLLDQSGRSSGMLQDFQILRQKGHNYGDSQFMKRSEFESSEYLKDDCFTLQCTLLVVKAACIDETKKQVVVPSSDLYHHFGKLLETRDGADVTFNVNEEIFIAHKAVLAARSPVFKAQFFGSMKKTESNSVIIEDVKPEVFKLMLHFIYTDMLPHEVEAEISPEMAQHLLVAADRYGLERLKLICGEILCRNLSVESSATTLVLAEQHNCKELKEVCVDFVSSRAVLNDVMASVGFKHLMESCPFLLKELLEKVDHSRRF